MKCRRIHFNGNEVLSIQVCEDTNISIETYAGVEVSFTSDVSYQVIVEKQGKCHIFTTDDFILAADVLEQALSDTRVFIGRDDVESHPMPYKETERV